MSYISSVRGPARTKLVAEHVPWPPQLGLTSVPNEGGECDRRADPTATAADLEETVSAQTAPTPPSCGRCGGHELDIRPAFQGPSRVFCKDCGFPLGRHDDVLGTTEAPEWQPRLDGSQLPLFGYSQLVQSDDQDVADCQDRRRDDWPAAVADFILLLTPDDLPGEPFSFGQATVVVDREKFLASLKSDILLGPTGPRARYGALQRDIERLRRLLI